MRTRPWPVTAETPSWEGPRSRSLHSPLHPFRDQKSQRLDEVDLGQEPPTALTSSRSTISRCSGASAASRLHRPPPREARRRDRGRRRAVRMNRAGRDVDDSDLPPAGQRHVREAEVGRHAAELFLGQAVWVDPRPGVISVDLPWSIFFARGVRMTKPQFRMVRAATSTRRSAPLLAPQHSARVEAAFVLFDAAITGGIARAKRGGESRCRTSDGPTGRWRRRARGSDPPRPLTNPRSVSSPTRARPAFTDHNAARRAHPRRRMQLR